MEIKIGDTVVIRSGGPTMTVAKIDTEDKSAQCQWFVKNELKDGWFPLASLQPIKGDFE